MIVRGEGKRGGKRRLGDDDDYGDDDNDDEDETSGGEASGRAETIERNTSPTPMERSDMAGTSAAPEVSHRRSPPRVPAEASPMTLQSLHDLLLEKRAARLEERAARQRLEAILLEERATDYGLRQCCTRRLPLVYD